MKGQPAWELGCVMLEMVMGEFPFIDYGVTDVQEELKRKDVKRACGRCNAGNRSLSEREEERVVELMCGLVKLRVEERSTIEEAVLGLRGILQ